MLFIFFKQLLCTTCSKTTQVGTLLYVERGLLPLNTNIVYSSFTSTFDNFDKPDV